MVNQTKNHQGMLYLESIKAGDRLDFTDSTLPTMTFRGRIETKPQGLERSVAIFSKRNNLDYVRFFAFEIDDNQNIDVNNPDRKKAKNIFVGSDDESRNWKLYIFNSMYR